MHDMSNTRNEIAARLGFAAGNGAKTAFANNDPALANFLVKYKENENNNYHSENVVLLAEFVGSSSEIAHAKDILRKVRAAGHLPSDLNDEQYSLYKNLAAKLKSKYPGAKFSRSGAKAKFAPQIDEAEQELKAWTKKLGYYPDMAKVNIRPNTVMLWFYDQKGKATQLASKLRSVAASMNLSPSAITSEEGRHPAYDGGAARDVGQVTVDYNRSTKSSRPGAKDEFGGMKGLGDWTVGFTDVMKERIAQLKQLAKSLKATVTLGRVSPNGMYSGTVTRQYGPMEPTDLTASTKVKQLIKSLGGYENDSWRYNARPGTKTTMTREQTEEQKAGLKIMSAADPAVGAKIAKLIKEGKPQDQAVAIALDMKRRGEL